MRQWLFCVFALMLPFGTPVAQAEHNGLELSQNCAIAIRSIENDTQPNAFNRGLCIGQVRGVLEAMQLWDAVDSKHTQQAAHGCVPFSVLPMEAVKVVIKYLNDNPEKLHEPDTILILYALSNAYPCKVASPGTAK